MLVGGANLELLQVAAVGVGAGRLARGLLGLKAVGIAHGWGVSPVVCVVGVEARRTLLSSVGRRPPGVRASNRRVAEAIAFRAPRADKRGGRARRAGSWA